MDDTLQFMCDVKQNNRCSSHKNDLSTKASIVLVGWRPKIKFSVQGQIFPNFAIVVEGLRADTGLQWASSEISAVDPPNRLYTKNTVYEIRGPIDKEKCRQRGFDMRYVEKFKNGFPTTWKEDTDQFVKALFAAVASKQLAQQEQFAPNDADEADPDVEEGDGVKSEDSFDVTFPSSVSDLSDPDDEKDETPSSPETVPQVTLLNPTKRRTSHASRLTIMPMIEEDNEPETSKRSSNAKRRSINTSEDKSVCSPAIRSRGGRLIKPRLSVGERIVYNSKGDVVEVRGNVTRTHHVPAASNSLHSIAKNLGINAPESPIQKERKLVNVTRKTPRRKSLGRKKPLVEYNSDEENKSLDGAELDRPVTEATPLPFHRNARRRISSDSEQSQPDMQTPAPRRRKIKKSNDLAPKPRTAKRKSTEMDDQSDAEESNADDTVATCQSKTGTAKKKKQVWNVENRNRLKGLVDLIKPMCDAHWTLVAKGFEDLFSAEECKLQATKMKLMKKPKAGDMDELQRSDELSEILKEFLELENCARSEKHTLRYMQKKDATEKKFFQEIHKLQSKTGKENVSQDGMDDSLVEIVKHFEPTASQDTCAKFTPRKRQYVPLPVMRRRSSAAGSQGADDSFRMHDWSNQCKTRFRLQN